MRRAVALLLLGGAPLAWAADEPAADGPEYAYQVCLSDGQTLGGREFVVHDGHSHLLIGHTSVRIPDESRVSPCVELYEGLSWPEEELVKYDFSDGQALIGVPIESSNGTLTLGLLDRNRVYLPDRVAGPSSTSSAVDPTWIDPVDLAPEPEPPRPLKRGVVVAIVVPVVLVGVAVGLGVAVATADWRWGGG